MIISVLTPTVLLESGFVVQIETGGHGHDVWFLNVLSWIVNFLKDNQMRLI